MMRRRPIARMAVTTAVVAGTASAMSNRAASKQQAAAQQQAAQQEAPEEDVYEQLTKLGKLHEQGILTDEEFAEQKSKLLG